MYSAPPPKGPENEPLSLEPDKNEVNRMAQRLFEHFSQMRLNQEEWVQCLNDFLATDTGRMPGQADTSQIQAKIDAILRQDKHLPMHQLSWDAQMAVYREVAEWLVAEKICEWMLNYEHAISEGIHSGRYRHIRGIEEVNVLWDDGEAFGNPDERKELARHLSENYVVDMTGPLVGSGTRVVVRELKPVSFPLPYPERDDQRDLLRLNVPNRYLVVRLLKESYRDRLGTEVMRSEQSAICSFLLASEALVAKPPNYSPEGIVNETRDEMAEEITLLTEGSVQLSGRSFIPPLMIVKAKIGQGGLTEYMTVQKKVLARGTVLRGETPMCRDMLTIPGLREQIGQFVQACKNFHARTGLLPDTVGHGNVLYTNSGKVYLVDINNITPEPHYRLLALLGLIKELRLALENPRHSEDERTRFEEVLRLATAEMQTEMNGKEQYLQFNNAAAIERILDNFYINHRDKTLAAFFRAAALTDDLAHPIFLHNISNLHGLEMDILRCELEEGLISEEEKRQRLEMLENDPSYFSLSASMSTWLGRRSYGFPDILDNKKQGERHWIANYVGRLYSMLTNDNLV